MTKELSTRGKIAVMRFWICLVCAVICGCRGGGGAQRVPDYNVIRLYNESPTEIYDIQLSAGATDTTLDRLPADHSPVSDYGVSPDPKSAEIRWRTADGRNVEKQVQIVEKMPRAFRGVILLRLQEDGEVGVQFVPYRDLR